MLGPELEDGKTTLILLLSSLLTTESLHPDWLCAELLQRAVDTGQGSPGMVWHCPGSATDAALLLRTSGLWKMEVIDGHARPDPQQYH